MHVENKPGLTSLVKPAVAATQANQTIRFKQKRAFKAAGAF